MKRTFLAVILILSLSLASCHSSVTEFSHDGVTYYYEYSDGIKTITNYHPYNFLKLPSYQEMVQLGDGAGLENEGVVYYIYVVDTSIDPKDTKAYYSAELDGETKALLCEDGEYFTSEVDKTAFINRLVYLIDTYHYK